MRYSDRVLVLSLDHLLAWTTEQCLGEMDYQLTSYRYWRSLQVWHMQETRCTTHAHSWYVFMYMLVYADICYHAPDNADNARSNPRHLCTIPYILPNLRCILCARDPLTTHLRGLDLPAPPITSLIHTDHMYNPPWRDGSSCALISPSKFHILDVLHNWPHASCISTHHTLSCLSQVKIAVKSVTFINQSISKVGKATIPFPPQVLRIVARAPDFLWISVKTRRITDISHIWYNRSLFSSIVHIIPIDPFKIWMCFDSSRTAW